MLKFMNKGVACVIGGFILCLSFASDFSYPNINSYLTSYMRSTRYNPTLSYADFIFVSGSKNLLQGASMPFIGSLARRLGTRTSILLGFLIYSLGFGLTYFTVQYYFPLAILSLSCHAIGFSFAYATAIRAAQMWFSQERKGLVGSIVIAGYGFGSMFWVPIQTQFVNPDNIDAEVDPNCTYIGTNDEELCDFYFVDEKVLSRIPWMFGLLGIIFLVMGLIAWLLISEPTSQVKEMEMQVTEKILEPNEDTSEDSYDNKCSLAPTQVIKTLLFYQIWFGFFSITLTNGLLNNYSKTFGLTFINDDHYYANLAILLNILNGSCRIFWGLVYDRIGYKKCFCVIAVAVTVATSTLPLLPYIGTDTLLVKVCYGLWMAVLYSTVPGVFSLLAGCITDAFGPAHYQANFGLIFSITVAYFTVIVPMTQIEVIYSGLGYIGMFSVGGVFGVVGLVATVFMPSDLRSQRFTRFGKDLK